MTIDYVRPHSACEVNHFFARRQVSLVSQAHFLSLFQNVASAGPSRTSKCSLNIELQPFRAGEKCLAADFYLTSEERFSKELLKLKEKLKTILMLLSVSDDNSF